MRDSVAGIEDDARSASGRVQREHRLDRGMQSRDVEGFEQNLGGCVAVTPWVERRFRQEYWMLE